MLYIFAKIDVGWGQNSGRIPPCTGVRTVWRMCSGSCERCWWIRRLVGVAHPHLCSILPWWGPCEEQHGKEGVGGVHWVLGYWIEWELRGDIGVSFLIKGRGSHEIVDLSFPRILCNIGCLSETHLELKSHKIFFVHNVRFNYYTPCNEVRGGILDSACLSVRLSVCLSICLSVNLSCPPCSIYSSWWILSIFGTNDH